jgi:hypothetical protein
MNPENKKASKASIDSIVQNSVGMLSVRMHCDTVDNASAVKVFMYECVLFEAANGLGLG